jgi:hypothetical protein
MKREFIDKELLPSFYNYLNKGDFAFEVNAQKHLIKVFAKDNNQKQLLKIRIPLNMRISDSNEIEFVSDITHYVLMVVKSGMACLGLFENFKNINHKVFRAYMVRKKQGTSQIKHLKTKGKSRAGSRVRLAETEIFLEEINTRLQQYFEQHSIDFIGLQVSELLKPYFFGSKIKTPFQKNDARILKIPVHVNQPTYETLLKINQYLLKAEIGYFPEEKNLWEEFKKENVNNQNTIDQEDW